MNDFLDPSRLLAVLQGERQQNRLLTLDFPNGDGPAALLLPDALDAEEGLSRDFRYTALLISEDAEIEQKTVLGKMVTIKLLREDGSYRYYNGYVQSFSRLKADGGNVFYTMVLTSWFGLLKLSRNHRRFIDKSLADIFKETCANLTQADYKFDLTGKDEPVRYRCQWDETDFNHLSRRMEQMGLYYTFEHRADGHTMVIRDDSPSAPVIDGLPEIPFQSEAGSLEDDGIAEFTPIRRAIPAQRSVTTFDFKHPTPQPAGIPTLIDQGDATRQAEVYGYAGAYAFDGPEEGDALVRREMEAIETGAKQFHATGNDRFVEPGRTFTLTGYIGDDADPDNMEFVVLQVRHRVQCNYLMRKGTPAIYTNSFVCQRKKIVWRPRRGHDSYEPKALGTQSAIVVCPDDEEIYTDEYGRIYAQFHWDREGQFNPASSIPMRVLTAVAGDRFGKSALPRRGQEVVVSWLDGNPDLPIVIGALPNAKNLPGHFTHEGALPANRAQSGWSTRELGGNRLQQLVFDDTTEKPSTQLATEYAQTELNLGHLRTPLRNGEADPRGEGAELRTLAAAVMRAAQGLFLLTESNAPEGKQLARETLMADLDAAREAVKALDSAAQQAKADAVDPQPQADLEAAIDNIDKGTNTSPDGNGGKLPVIGIAAQAGLALTSAKAMTLYAGDNLDVVGNRNLQHTVGAQWIANAKASMSWFAAGQQMPSGQTVSMKWIAGAGNVLMQAQQGKLDIEAQQTLRLGSNATVQVDANGGVVLTEQGGAQIELKGGNVTIKCPGTFTVHSASYGFTGAATGAAQLPSMPGSTEIRDWLGLRYLDPHSGEPIAEAPYEVKYGGGATLSGTLDGSGKARHDSVPPFKLKEVDYKPRTPKEEQPTEPLEKLL